ncbi:hypothetical protein J6U32_09650 [Gordonia polyisoprenivorans]|nr:hypothetical protein J6U32_09650 [Gordonia polyisoprenivorans]
MTAYPHDRYGLIRRDAALRRGISDSCRANDVKAGQLISLIPGVNVEPSADFDGHEGAQKLHRLRAIAVATSEIARPLPLSHASAAAMLGLPLLKPDLARVHVTTGLPGGGSVGTVRHLHPAPLDPAELRTIDGLVVTSLERTAIDVATMGDFAQAFTAFDQALRLGADRDQMSEMLAARRRRGGKVARVALTSATGQAESVGESWSCAQIVDARYPAPRQQHGIRVASGSTYVTDFDWEWLVVGEFDGMIKYGRLRRPGESIADAVIREKLREDEIRDTGPRVVRWTWNDLERDAFIPRLHRRLAPLGFVAA